MVGNVWLNFGYVSIILVGNLIWKADFSENNFYRKFYQPQNCHSDVYIYSETPLARPPTGRHSIVRDSGTGVVASHLRSYFHLFYLGNKYTRKNNK